MVVHGPAGLLLGERRTPYVVLAAVATAGSVMVSYAARARRVAHTALQSGIHGAPEPAGLLIIGGLFNRMGPGCSGDRRGFPPSPSFTRIVYTWQETRADALLPGIKLSL